MLLLNLFTALLAVVLPNPSPSASPGERELPTIVTVISSPYCNSLADHFNGALVPMLANDRVLEGTSVQLDTLNTLFHQTNYVQQYMHVQDQIERQETILNESLAGISRNIVTLRDGAALTTDAQAKAEVTKASWELQTAYDHQRQLAIDLMNLYLAMRNYKVNYANPPMGGFSEREMTESQAMRDSKNWLHFDSQRAVIAQSEDQAVDTAYLAAQTYCVPKK
jgi:hypothetical protein